MLTHLLLGWWEWGCRAVGRVDTEKINVQIHYQQICPLSGPDTFTFRK